MMFITHAVIALMFYFLFMALGVPFTLKADIVATVVGALIPDIDHTKSFISRANLLFLGASKAISQTGHRGITHSMVGLAVFSILASLVVFYYNLDSLVIFAFMLGYFSHLAADSLNPSGVRWLQPFNNKFVMKIDVGILGVRLAIPSGGRGEKIIFFISSILMVAFFYIACY